MSKLQRLQLDRSNAARRLRDRGRKLFAGCMGCSCRRSCIALWQLFNYPPCTALICFMGMRWCLIGVERAVPCRGAACSRGDLGTQPPVTLKRRRAGSSGLTGADLWRSLGIAPQGDTQEEQERVWGGDGEKHNST